MTLKSSLITFMFNVHLKLDLIYGLKYSLGVNLHLLVQGVH